MAALLVAGVAIEELVIAGIGLATAIGLYFGF